MPSITSANVANAIIRMVAADALPAVVGNMVVGNLVHRDYEPTLAMLGDSVTIPIAPILVANAIKPGDSPKIQHPLTSATIVLNSHAEATFQIPDVTKVLCVPELLKVYMQPAVMAIAEKMESDLLNLYAGFTANVPLGTAGTPITETIIDHAEAALFNARVPTGTPKYLAVDSNTYSAMRQIPRFSEFHNCGEAGLRALVNGTIGKVKGFFVFRSHFVQKTGTTTVNTHNMAFCKDAIGLVIRRLPQPLPGTGVIAEYTELGNFGMRIIMNYQPNTLSQQFTIDVLYGCSVLRNNFAVQVSS